MEGESGVQSGAGGGVGQQMVSCPSCGAANRPGQAFCMSCGYRLDQGYGGIQQAGAPAVRPPVQVQSGMPGYQAYQQPYGPQGVNVVQQYPAPSSNGLCVAALVLGICGLFFMWVPFLGIALGILATIFGAVGIGSADKRGQPGKGMGIAGLVMGLVDLGLNIVFIVVVWGIFVSVTQTVPY